MARQARTTEDQQVVNKAMGEATTQLRRKHQAEYHRLVQKIAKANGVEWSPRPSATEKAASTLKELLEQHPELQSRFGVQAPDGHGDAEVVPEG